MLAVAYGHNTHCILNSNNCNKSINDNNSSNRDITIDKNSKKQQQPWVKTKKCTRKYDDMLIFFQFFPVARQVQLRQQPLISVDARRFTWMSMWQIMLIHCNDVMRFHAQRICIQTAHEKKQLLSQHPDICTIWSTNFPIRCVASCRTENYTAIHNNHRNNYTCTSTKWKLLLPILLLALRCQKRFMQYLKPRLYWCTLEEH